MIHEQTAFAIADPIDDAHPLVLPSLRTCNPAGVELAQSGKGTAAGFSGSVPAAAPHSELPGAARSCPSDSAGEAPPPIPAGWPPVAAGHTFAGVPVASMEAVMAQRTRQIAHFGHTPDKDLGLRPSVLPDRAIRYLVNAQEDLQFRRGEYRASARRHLAQAGAMVLAAIDYLDAGGGQ
jgi:hypothetical protein